MTHVECTIERPGFKYPWVCVIQDSESGTGLVWAVYSQAQRSMVPRYRGEAATVDAAKEAARRAVEAAE